MLLIIDATQIELTIKMVSFTRCIDCQLSMKRIDKQLADKYFQINAILTRILIKIQIIFWSKHV